jgi:ABC-2 type transport system ATP-binding protein/ribosome-dependent ATPase
MSAVALLESDAVTCCFGEVAAVSEVTMAVAAGEVVGLLGANGAGKTTLIRMLLGVLPVTSGRVRLLGGPPDRAHRRRLGYVSQGTGLYSDLTVAENVAFVATLYGVPAPDLPLALAEFADTLVGEVSLGVQRRVAFTCALLHTPKVLVLDEPTSGVDPLARADLWDTVREQAGRGVGALVTTHYMQEAQQCDRLLLMSDGHLVGHGSERDVIGDTTAVEVSTQDWAAAFAVLAAAGEPVSLAGRAVRVADGDPGRIITALQRAGVPGQVRSVPATLEERMTVLARASSTGGRPTDSGRGLP